MKILQCSRCGKDVEMTFEFTGKYPGRAKLTICTDCALASASSDVLWLKDFHEQNREFRKGGFIDP